MFVIGAFADSKKLYCYFRAGIKKKNTLAMSTNAEDFEITDGQLSLSGFDRINLSRLDIGNMGVIELKNGRLKIAVCQDKIKWKTLCLFKEANYTSGAIVSNYQINGDYLIYLGGKKLSLGVSRNGRRWRFDTFENPHIPIKYNESIVVDLAEKLSRGLLVCYRLIQKEGYILHHQVHLVLFDPNFPSRIVWRSPSPIWEEDSYEGEHCLGGSTIFRSQIFSFWNRGELGINLVRYPVVGLPFDLPRDQSISLLKARSNPIIYPRSNYPWESFATYNPAALQLDGTIHILYRAQGHDLISSKGYASSNDGVNIDERLDSPVYYPQEVFECSQTLSAAETTSEYRSGGGIAGCEDPRVTMIDNRIYMTYVAFDGSNPPRVALTSIDLQDFLAKRWFWQRPVLISPPGIVDKSAVIFPEKIKDKYVIMHRIFPNILIDYVSDLNFDGTRWLKGQYHIPIRNGFWDSRKIGAGAPPLKTRDGWLLIYYGVDDRDDRFYKIGAMLLDLENPAKVLYRSNSPILEPETWYENSGFKPGVAYPCGAVILGEKLMVYYGGADCVVCVASAVLTEFLKALKSFMAPSTT